MSSGRRAIGKNVGVKLQMQRVNGICKCNFATVTLLKKEGKTVELAIIALLAVE
jgi:hypothetical protein